MRQSQLNKVRQVMELNCWITLYRLAELVGCSECGVSARIRDLRKMKNGGMNIIKRRISKSTWQYRLVA